ncbi:phytosulfokine receptor 1-like [Quercus lobata]|uniref:phytosulfokine receptor 1-like n=1 Tax=Quercus lobata TaxID=97700 RepID=UPI0012460A91|nr:phytosulfokine receptor 1-like [Quercus lobata]
MFFRRICLLFVLMFLGLSLQLPNLNSETLTCNPDDLRALNGFSNCLVSTIPGWNGTDSPGCCTWTGVTCDNSTGFDRRVVGLELGSKILSGKICGSLVGLNQLRVLNFSHNFLQGSLPDELFSLPNIEIIDISNNGFVGSINKGSLPESFFQLKNLSELNLRGNSISGSLSNGIGNLSNLVKLEISSNLFSGVLPDIFMRLARLKLFSARSNLFSGHLPTSLVNSPSLQMLYLNNNSLSGPINLNCSAMKNLVSLGLGSNLFHSPIPDSLFSCRGLKALDLARNNLGGELPNNFKNLKSLTQLSLSNTSLSNILSALTILQHCSNLSMLVLSMNFHDEQMPNDENLHFENLNSLLLSNCQLRGPIPQWLSRCHKLQFLELSWNHLGGNIPSWVGKFDSLFYLDLSNNSLKGEIPKSLTELQSLISGKVTIEGPISAFEFYTRQGGSVLIYRQLSSFRPTIDLSCNILHGPIWPGFGNLKRLHVLNLNENKFSGPIPNNLSCMTDLEKLDLSHNKLSGEIPYSLINLCFLSNFNISYNQLWGEIPQGGQFDTFPNTSFEGNNGLHYAQCACQSEQIPVLSITERKRTIIGLPFKIGAATGFVLTVICCFMSGLALPKPHKRKYIRFVTS